VAVKNMPIGSMVIGVDLLPIKAIRGVKTLIGDITTQECRHMIRKETDGNLIDVVLCDGAPNVGGAWSSEAYTQSELVLEAARMASDILAPNGTFVTKVFRSKDYSALIFALKQLFKKVEATKPAASRNASAEIFVVCQGYKAPSKIDPRIFDSKYIFCDFQEAPKIEGPDALLRAKDKQRRFREGYEDGISTTFKEIQASDFVQEDNPVELLGKYTKIKFALAAGDEISEFVNAHKSTTDEIRTLCSDLQVLGRSEFKQLLKWRLGVKKDLEKLLKAQQPEPESSSEDEEDKEEEGQDVDNVEDDLMQEMESIKERMEKRLKREKKKRREQKMNARIRSAQLAQAEGIGEDQMEGPESLFSLKGIKGKVTKVSEMDAPDYSSEDDDHQRSIDDATSSDSDLDERRRKYDEKMDEYLEQSYKDWKVRQRMTQGGALKKKRKRLGMSGELEMSEDEDTKQDSDKMEISDESSSDEEENELLVDLDQNENKITPVDTWFSQDVFDGQEDESLSEADDESSDADESEDGAAPEPDDEPQDEDDLSSDLNDEINDVSDERMKRNGDVKSNGFEVVPVSEDESDSAEEEFERLDDNAKAEIIALAKKFIHKKSKKELIEAAYNKYAFHDTDLPKWFVDDENKYMRPAPFITGQEFNEAKQQLQTIDARPIKKIAEAKARKRKRLQAKLTQARQKAEAVANQQDVPASAKMREIEKIYKQAKFGSNKKKKPSRSDQYKRKGPALDARLRSDRRGLKAAEKRNKKKGRGRR
jgi:AdoMet-dependent rRNA methyltransferase SPB1